MKEAEKEMKVTWKTLLFNKEEEEEKKKHPETPPSSPKEEVLYLPAIMGCRSMESSYQWLNKIEEGTYGVVGRPKNIRTGKGERGRGGKERWREHYGI